MQGVCRIKSQGTAGYHYTRAHLDQMEDPEEAHARRGAPWTFDAEAFIEAIETLRKHCELFLLSGGQAMHCFAFEYPLISPLFHTFLVVFEGSQ